MAIDGRAWLGIATGVAAVTAVAVTTVLAQRGPDSPDASADASSCTLTARDRLDLVIDTEKFPGYAGETVEYDGPFGIDYYFTGPAPERLIQSLDEHDLQPCARFHEVEYSLDELVAIQTKLIAPEVTIDVQPGVDVWTNRVLLNAATQGDADRLDEQGLTARELTAVTANVDPTRTEAN